MVPPNENLEADIEAWLQDKHSTMWADWEIVNDDSRQDAAAWFAAEMRDFTQHRFQRSHAKVRPSHTPTGNITTQGAWDVING